MNGFCAVVLANVALVCCGVLALIIDKDRKTEEGNQEWILKGCLHVLISITIWMVLWTGQWQSQHAIWERAAIFFIFFHAAILARVWIFENWVSQEVDIESSSILLASDWISDHFGHYLRNKVFDCIVLALLSVGVVVWYARLTILPEVYMLSFIVNGLMLIGVEKIAKAASDLRGAVIYKRYQDREFLTRSTALLACIRDMPWTKRVGLFDVGKTGVFILAVYQSSGCFAPAVVWNGMALIVRAVWWWCRIGFLSDGFLRAVLNLLGLWLVTSPLLVLLLRYNIELQARRINWRVWGDEGTVNQYINIWNRFIRAATAYACVVSVYQVIMISPAIMAVATQLMLAHTAMTIIDVVGVYYAVVLRGANCSESLCMEVEKGMGLGWTGYVFIALRMLRVEFVSNRRASLLNEGIGTVCRYLGLDAGMFIIKMLWFGLYAMGVKIMKFMRLGWVVQLARYLYLDWVVGMLLNHMLMLPRLIIHAVRAMTWNGMAGMAVSICISVATLSGWRATGSMRSSGWAYWQKIKPRVALLTEKTTALLGAMVLCTLGAVGLVHTLGLLMGLIHHSGVFVLDLWLNRLFLVLAYVGLWGAIAVGWFRHDEKAPFHLHPTDEKICHMGMWAGVAVYLWCCITPWLYRVLSIFTALVTYKTLDGEGKNKWNVLWMVVGVVVLATRGMLSLMQSIDHAFRLIVLFGYVARAMFYGLSVWVNGKSGHEILTSAMQSRSAAASREDAGNDVVETYDMHPARCANV